VVVGRGNLELNLILNHGERRGRAWYCLHSLALSAVEVKHSINAHKSQNLVLSMDQMQNPGNESLLPYVEISSFWTHKSCNLFSCF